MFRKVLIANRGEIAVRIARTLREMGIASIAAFSDADVDALFVQEADEAFRLGPAPPHESYLNVDSILDVCRRSGAEAVHPGYGFLAENAGFAQAVRDAGMAFIGPNTDAIERMGDKISARRSVAKLGVPIVPGMNEPVRNLSDVQEFVRQAGLPVAIKAAGGGGGRGIRIVRQETELEGALESAAREARSSFKSPDVYLERFFENPRHIEIQILADQRGSVLHLGERDCSVQRRHQKLIEETPSPAVSRALRAEMGEAAIRAAQSVGYDSAGTVEFLLTDDGSFYFLEMNTRIQVEHPITEAVTGVDIVREMVLAATGEPLTVYESVLDPNGHAIEVRINAEDVALGFRPTPSTISMYLPPGGPGTRVDAGVYAGYAIPPNYDSLISKLIAWGPDREQSRRRALRALAEYRIAGPATTIAFARELLANSTFVEGNVSTTWLERNLSTLIRDLASPASLADENGAVRAEPRQFDVEVNRKLFRVQVAEIQSKGDGARAKRPRKSGTAQSSNAILSPMHGTIASLRKRAGDEVGAGETVAVIEAMKMENEIAAPRAGRIAELLVAEGETVEADQRIATIE